ncbi:MAG: hypothetical protein GX811_11970 [Lentisphaerae bacterium]|nr:hypothetical protein [Lentisphaerota bacterium]
MNDKVMAERFYQDDADKIKLNWFCYEYANILYWEIERSDKLAGYRAKNKPDRIADFCLYYAKRMKKSVYNSSAGKTKGVQVSDQYIYEYKPDCPGKLARALLEAAEAALDEMNLVCSVCGNRSLSEWFALTPMFDNLAKNGWPT